MPRYTCQFCGGASRAQLQISPIDPTLKLCSNCVRYQRIQVSNNTITVVKQEKTNEKKKTKKQAEKKIVNSVNPSMDSPQIKKTNGVQKTYTKSNKNENFSNDSVPIMKKKKKQHANAGHEKQNSNRKRKLDSNIMFARKKKKIKLSSIFDPQKAKKEGQLRKSKYYGVFWNRTNGTWTAKYSCGGKSTHVTSGKNENKVAKELRKAIREAIKNGARPKKPYGKLKDPKPKTNSVVLSANDIELVNTEYSSESSQETPIMKKKPIIPNSKTTKMNIFSTKPMPQEQNTSIVKKTKVKQETLSSAEVKAKRKFIYKGVSWNKKRQCWVGQIQYKGKQYFCKASKNASIVAECVRKKAAELRKEGIDIPKGYGTRKLNKNVETEISEPKLKKTRKAKAKPKKEYYRSSSDSEVESSEQLTSSYDWTELKKQGRKYNAPLKSKELFSISLNWNEMLSGKTLDDGEPSASGGSSSDNAGYF